MADDTHGHGGAADMDIRDHTRTWHSFTKGVKWSIVGLIIIGIILLVFRTHG